MTLLAWITAYSIVAFCTHRALSKVDPCGLSRPHWFLALTWPLTLLTGIIRKIRK